MTLLDIIKEKYPDEVARFDKEPYDYAIYSTGNLEEPVQFTVMLKVGTRYPYKERMYFRVTVGKDCEVVKEERDPS
jgi:hypothetical protein